MEGTLGNSGMRESEDDGAGWQPPPILRETSIIRAMKTAAGRGAAEATRERKEGLAGIWNLPTWGKLCVSSFPLVGLEEIIRLPGDPFA